MAFASFSPSSITEMLGQLHTFVTTDLAWSATWDGTELAITPAAGGAVFRLTEEPDSYGDTGVPQLVLTTEETINATLESFTTVMSHVYSTSVCWFYGGAEPEPWLHLVVQVTPGTYRHAYLGYLEKYGAWTGGAVCDANQVGRWSTIYYDWIHSYSHCLFGSVSEWSHRRPAGRTGGVMIHDHGYAGQSPQARFSLQDGYSSLDMPTTYPRAAGGPDTQHGMRLRDPGVASYSGEAALGPITLFADFMHTGNWTPLGRVCGIRLVHMDAFNPEEVLSYAGRTWRLFPWTRKPPSVTDEPHSGNLGLAVLEA